jgi:BirA family biotin operon repressor/biotin-[acetyl-CoA-carboxylase] ligase
MLDQNTLTSLRAELSLGEVAFFSSLPSTNDTAREWLARGCENYSLVTADEQTKGKGRSGRTWYTLPGTALAFSFILTETRHPPNLLTGVAALAVHDALSGLVDRNVEIKWPNDILIEGKKAAGILVESQWTGDQLLGIIIGIGVNISSGSLAFSEPVRFPAVYLENFTAQPVSQAALLRAIITRIIAWERESDPGTIVSEWNKRLAFRGETVTAVRSEKASIDGILTGIDHNGDLILVLPDTQVVHYSANEIQIKPYRKED